jgi:uncharacterized protein (DUF1499 family)
LEKLLIILVSISLVVVVALLVLGYMSHSAEVPGVVDGRLQQCPDKPNCVNSEFESDAEHFVEPLVYSADNAGGQVLSRLKTIIVDMGGNIEIEASDYLAATFTSSIFRFVDELEIRVDSSQKVIHLRSASRVGHGDGGVNRKRVALLKKTFDSQMD